MKKFILQFAFFCIVLSTLLVCSIFFIPNLSIRDSLYYALPDKHAYLNKEKSPRIILIGGSNLSFGINSKIMGDSLKLPVINMGLHAGLGLRFICLDVMKFLKPNDIIIICPEYAHFFINDENIFYGSDELLYILFDVNPDLKKLIDFKQWMHLIKYLPKYAAEKIYYFPKALINSLKPNENKEIGVYNRSSFNEYGDVIAHYNMGKVSFSINEYSGKINEDAIDFLQDYYRELKKRNITLFFYYPAYEYSAYIRNQKALQQLDEKLHDKLSIPFLSSMQDGIMKDDLFFNTEYHLNKKGIDIRTQNLVNQLQQRIYFKNYPINDYKK